MDDEEEDRAPYAPGHEPGEDEDSNARVDNDIGSWFEYAGEDISNALTPGSPDPSEAEAAARDEARGGGDGSLGSSDYARERRARAQNNLSDFDKVSQNIPIWDWLSGADANAAAAAAQAEADINREYWEGLVPYMPDSGTLTADYDEEDYIAGPGSEWATDTAENAAGRAAMGESMDQLGTWAEGGFTSTDMAMMDENRRREGMSARADREAALSALEARGMGGSGANLASMLSANEGAAARGTAAETSILAAAQNRQLQATRDRASVAGASRDASARETAGREAYNSGESEYRRGLEGRNTGTRNREEDTRIAAEQNAYGNRERAVAGITNQYATDVGSRAASAAAETEADRSLAGAIGGLLDF
jgi:hypothetical protein